MQFLSCFFFIIAAYFWYDILFFSDWEIPAKRHFISLNVTLKWDSITNRVPTKPSQYQLFYSSLLKCKTTGLLTHDCRRKKKFNLILKGHFHFSDSTMVLRYGSLHIQTLKKNYFSVLNFCSVLTFSIMWYLLKFEFLKSRSIRRKCDTVSNV